MTRIRQLHSPSGELKLSLLEAKGEGDRLQPAFSIQRAAPSAGAPETVLLQASRLGLSGAAASFTFTPSEDEPPIQFHNEPWQPPYGEQTSIPNTYHRAVTPLGPNGALAIEWRVYDEGVAFRYLIPEGSPCTGVVDEEMTEFHFPPGCLAYEEHGTEGEYVKKPIGDIRPNCEWPLTIVYPDGAHAYITEAALLDSAQMKFSPGSTRDSLKVTLQGPVQVQAPFVFPWRLIVFADSPGGLLEKNYMTQNLNPPSVLPDASWVKPGKAIRDITLSTQGAMECVDFAERHNLQYVAFDAGWYGRETDENADATAVAIDEGKVGPNHPGLDLHAAIDYARARGIGVLLYVNRRALERQLDEILPLYASWGVKGVKYGFVRVGSQEAQSFLVRAIRKAAECGLVLDIHDAYRPSGLSRTYPHLLTQEGVRGNEHMPTPTHNTTLPFTRFTIGAADYTICWNDRRLKATRAHQMALSVIFYSPIQFLFWYDRPRDYKPGPEIDFFERLPTVWDERRVLHGVIGEHATLARRTGDEWFLGSITNEQEREVQIPLHFLQPGATYSAHIYSDDPTSTHENFRIVCETRTVTASTVLPVRLNASGGIAVRLSPNSGKD